jgi:hypothetical protein
MLAFTIFLVRVLSNSRQKHLGRVIFFVRVNIFYASIQYSICYARQKCDYWSQNSSKTLFRRVKHLVRVIILCKHLLFFSSEFCIISVKFISVEAYILYVSIFYARFLYILQVLTSEFFQFRVKTSSAESNIWYVSLFSALFQCFARQIIVYFASKTLPPSPNFCCVSIRFSPRYTVWFAPGFLRHRE